MLPDSHIPASRDVVALWHFADSGAASAIDATCRAVCEGLAALVAAECSSFLLARRQRGDDWKPLRIVRFGREVELRTRAGDALLRKFEDGLTEPGTRRILEAAGQHRVAARTDLYTPEEWGRSHARALKEATQLGDRLVGVCSVSRDVEVFFLFDRAMGAADFGAVDRATIANAMPGFARMCRWFALSHGASEGCQLLAPSERKVLFELLGPSSEKALASRLSFRPSYAHQLVVNVYRKMAVQSRAELSALWLAGAQPLRRAGGW